MNFNKGLSPLGIMLLLSSGLMLTGCNKEQATPPMPMASVEVITIKANPVDVTTELPGRISAYRIAEIRPQVSGTILKRLFTEGSEVQENQSLYLINPASYQTTYDSAKATLASAVADAKVTELTAKRYKSLLGTNAVSKQDYDNAVAAADRARASVKAGEAAVEAAKINLDYTKVYAPISGLIGKSSVTEGALVTAAQPTALATVQQLDPIYVDLTQSAKDYLHFKQEMSSGVLTHSNEKMPVTLILEDGSLYPHQGQLEFSDVSVNETTGTISLRAEFPNPDRMLLPGMFMRALLSEGTRSHSILVPQKAITRDNQGGAIVKVVDAENKVKSVKVNATLNIGNDWLITDGLHDGDKVIVSGLQKVRDGDQVNIAQPQSAPQQ